MVNNIKTEIIYYCNPTDFEFEFNLCGSCQMRLLTNSAKDKTELLKVLQKSISRSRVIILIGNIKGENGIINYVSKSIGYTCDLIDTDIYNVKSADDILLINNSVPLITDNGEFGGCIIESGPQSMIFLSDDKTVRKEIMTNLVYGYLKDLSRYPIQAAAKGEYIQPDIESSSEQTIECDAEPEVSPEQQPDDYFEEISSKSIDVSENETEIDEVNHEVDPYSIDNIINNDTFDFDTASENSSEKAPIVYEDDDYFNEQQKYATHKKAKILDVITLILCIIILILLAFIVYSYIFLPLKNGISIEENLKNILFSLFG